MKNEANQLIDNKNAEEQGIEAWKVAQESTFDIMGLLFQTIYESIATFLFVCCIYFCQGDVSKFIFGMWVILVLFGQFSGAHVNPAITLAFYIFEANWANGLIKLAFYWVGQFLGAFVAALIAREFYKNSVYVGVPTTSSLFMVMYSEFFFTGTFAFVILYVCSQVTHPSKNSPMNCAIIVGWFYLIVNAGSQFSGAAYNPAVLTVLNSLAVGQDTKAVRYLLAMIGSQLLGVMLFAVIFKYLFENYIKKLKTKE
jgi:glycerol uptake facilitator-like aquaporin